MAEHPVTSTRLPELPRLTAAKPPRKRRVNESLSTWRWTDRAGYVLCWAAGLSLCAIAFWIVGYMGYKGLKYLDLSMLVTHPTPELVQAKSGGFLDPILGTVLLTIVGIVVATPIAVVAAVWVVEYGRPSWLARSVESAIEVIAGTPDIVIAIFGLALFQHTLFAPLSFTAEGGAVFGRSFMTAGAMMSLIALPMVYGATREGLQAIPRHMREASYGLGKTRIATIRRVLLPAVRSNISTGAALGMGRIAGDTAIVVVLLGATLRLEKEGAIPGFDVLKGTGSTLTSYVYNNSPAGEGAAPDKAYAAAFVLLLVVIGLNFAVDAIARRGAKTGMESTRLGA
jgi:phosphate transport system permease protein